jgi:hypothetical protein
MPESSCGLHGTDDFPQSATSRVQTPLDRSDWAGELLAHFLQRRAFKVERPQSFSIQMTELAQTFANLFDVFLSNHCSKRSVFRFLKAIEGFRFHAGFGRSPNSPIDGQSNGDLTQPASESLGLLQLRKLSECAEEDLLHHLISFGRIPQPLHDDPEDSGFKQHNEIAERLPVAGLCSQNKWNKRISDHESDSSLKITQNPFARLPMAVTDAP